MITFLVLILASGILLAASPQLIGTIEGVPGEDRYLGETTKGLAKGDINGDGYTDLVVGSRQTEKIRVYFGDDVGIDATADVTILAPTEAVGGFYGHAVGVGDINGDGFDDIVTGAPWTTIEGSANAGYVYVYLGGNPMDTEPDLTIPCPHPFRTNAWFGYAIAVGYFNTDEYADFYISATRGSVWGMQPYQYPGNWYEGPDAETYNGLLYFFAGGETLDGEADMDPIIGQTSSGQAGNRGMDVADVDGNGWDDLLVDEHGATYNTNNPMDYCGKVSMYLGGKYLDNAQDIIIPKQDSTNKKLEFFGSTISSAGDVNGDGFDDMIVGTHPDHNNGGRVYLFYGPLKSLEADMILLAPAEAAPKQNSWGTYGLQQLGDINGDGYGDFLVNGYQENNESGKAYIFLGGTNVGSYLTLNGEENSFSQFGISSLPLGDINGDGYDDFLVSASAFGQGQGKLYIYAGAADISVGVSSPAINATVPNNFVVSQNYPNPFNPITSIEFELPEADHVTLTIYNNLGKVVKLIVDEEMSSGYHRIDWDGKDASGNSVSTGVYYYRIKTNSVEIAKKMTLLK